MKLVPSPLKIGDTDGFARTDVFGYGEFGERLANVICAAEDPLTIVLDGPWGSGKSTFIRQWAGLLRNRDVQVIHFDAFANDYLKDAFIAVTGEIIAKAEEFDPGGEAGKKLVEKAKDVGKVLVRHGASAIVRFATAGALDGNSLVALGEDTVDAASGKAGDVVGDLIAKQLESRRDERKVMAEFRRQLEDLAAAMRKAAPEGEAQPPLVFIIDELDRCRPSFALDLLERIKHLFAVPGVVFVLVTNLEQLQHAVRGAYGEGTDGALYLEKFYDLRVVLPIPEHRRNNPTRKYLSHLWDAMGLRYGGYNVDETLRDGLAALIDGYRGDLRGIEKVVSHVALVCAATGDRTLRLSQLIGPLCVMRRAKPDLYARARSGTLEYPQVEEFLTGGRWERESTLERYRHWWRYATDDGQVENEPWFSDINGGLFSCGIEERFDLVPWACRLIDDMATANG
ncbi:MAG: P-loop NTPase fold protein [Bacteroidota bacterium]